MAQLGSTGAATSEAQRLAMEKTVGKGVCPFCDVDPNITRVIREGVHWYLCHNAFPYAGLSLHIIIASKKHLTSVAKVSPEMAAELFGHIQWAVQEFKIPGGGVLMRFGDPAYHGGSISHLHLHIEVPDGGVPVEDIFYKKRPS